MKGSGNTNYGNDNNVQGNDNLGIIFGTNVNGSGNKIVGANHNIQGNGIKMFGPDAHPQFYSFALGNNPYGYHYGIQPPIAPGLPGCPVSGGVPYNPAMPGSPIHQGAPTSNNGITW